MVLDNVSDAFRCLSNLTHSENFYVGLFQIGPNFLLQLGQMT